MRKEGTLLSLPCLGFLCQVLGVTFTASAWSRELLAQEAVPTSAAACKAYLTPTPQFRILCWVVVLVSSHSVVMSCLLTLLLISKMGVPWDQVSQVWHQ